MLPITLCLLLVGIVVSQPTANRTPIKLDVHFISLCPDSIAFFKNQFKPFWDNNRNEFDIEYYFNPFGKTKISNETKPTITCQHGPDECVINHLIACAMRDMKEQSELVKYVICAMTAYDVVEAQKCYKSQVKDEDRRKKFDECNKEENRLEIFNELKAVVTALEPPLSYVPRIDINGKYDPEAELKLLEKLKAASQPTKEVKERVNDGVEDDTTTAKSKTDKKEEKENSKDKDSSEEINDDSSEENKDGKENSSEETTDGKKPSSSEENQ